MARKDDTAGDADRSLREKLLAVLQDDDAGDDDGKKADAGASGPSESRHYRVDVPYEEAQRLGWFERATGDDDGDDGDDADGKKPDTPPKRKGYFDDAAG